MPTLKLTDGVYEPNVLLEEEIEAGDTINQIVSDIDVLRGVPVLCIYNDRPTLRAYWDTPLASDDKLHLHILPKDPNDLIETVSTIAGAGLTIFGIATGSALFIGAGLGLLAVGLGLIDLFTVEGPNTPDASERSQTYSLRGQSNLARLGEAIPVIYGKIRVFPDLAGPAWSEYEQERVDAGTRPRQTLHQSFVVGLGRDYVLTDYRYGGTLISSFESVTIDQLSDDDIPSSAPVEKADEALRKVEDYLTYPNADVTNLDVGWDEDETEAPWIGPFRASLPGHTVSRMAVDIAFQQGLYGKNSITSFAYEIQWREINTQGVPQGDWVIVEHTWGSRINTISANWQQPIIFTLGISAGLRNGRQIEVRMRAKTRRLTEQGTRNDFSWIGLRGVVQHIFTDRAPDGTFNYIGGSLILAENWSDLTILKSTAIADKSLSANNANRFNVIVDAKTPAYKDGVWTKWTRDEMHAQGFTTNIPWIFADLLRSEFGANLPDDRLDLDNLTTVATHADMQGFNFNGIFDKQETVWSGLRKVASVGRCVPAVHGGRILLIRDRHQQMPTSLYNSRNIIKGSFAIEYSIIPDDRYDGVLFNYLNEEFLWTQKSVWTSNNGLYPNVPRTLDLFGVTNQTQAQVLSDYTHNSKRYQNQRISFSTELEGLLPQVRDLILVQHDTPDWSTGGDIIAVETKSDGVYLTLSTVCPLPIGPVVLWIRNRDGSVVNASDSSPTLMSPTTVRLSADTDINVHVNDSGERTLYSIDSTTPNDRNTKQCIVKAIKPSNEYRVDIECVNYDPRVFGL